MMMTRGLGFVVELPREANAHYAGKGVSLGAPGMPIFWYRPKDAKKYRVIYADLSVREADAPPNVSRRSRCPPRPVRKSSPAVARSIVGSYTVATDLRMTRFRRRRAWASRALAVLPISRWLGAIAAIRRSTSVKYGHTSTQFRHALCTSV